MEEYKQNVEKQISEIQSIKEIYVPESINKNNYTNNDNKSSYKKPYNFESEIENSLITETKKSKEYVIMSEFSVQTDEEDY